MKFNLLVALAVLGLVNGAPVDSLGPRANTHHRGINAWYLGHLESDSEVDQAMKEIKKSGIDLIRSWGFGDDNNPGGDVYYRLFQNGKATLNTNANTGFPRMQAVVRLAEANGLKLVLPLMNGQSYQGIDVYRSELGCGGNAENFFTSSTCQAAYKDWIHTMISHFKDSPAIYAWELANEIRCAGCSNSVITKWATETAQYIKSLDSKHLVAMGDEGWLSNEGNGVDWSGNLYIKDIDYATMHLYPQAWGKTAAWGVDRIASHTKRAAQAGKRLFLEEYGWQGTSTAQTESVLQSWQNEARKAGAAGDFIWQFTDHQPSISSKTTDGFAVVYGNNEYQEVVIDNAKKWEAL